MRSRRIKMTPIGILFFLISVLSICGYILDFFKLPATGKGLGVIVSLVTSINEAFAAHPLPFSLFFIAVAVLDDLYYAFQYNVSPDDLSVRFGKYIKYFLTGLNVICCVDILNGEGIQQKLAWVQNNKEYAILIVVIMVPFVILTELLQKNISAKHEQEKIHQEIQSNPKGINDANLPPAIMRHPFAYAYENLKIKAAKSIVGSVPPIVDSSKEETNGNSTQETPDSQKETKGSNNSKGSKIVKGLSYTIFVGITAGLIAFIGVGIRKITSGEFSLQKIKEILEVILTALVTFNANADPIKIAALTFLLYIGTIISLVIIFFVLIYGITFIFRAWGYMLLHINDSETDVQDFSKKIQRFFTESVTSVLRLLLFFPDFLETVEEIVLDFDEQDKQDK